MADIKNEHEEADFDFSGGDWMDEETPAAAGIGKDNSESDDPFGAGAFGDDDPFGGPEPSQSADPFASADDDPFGEGAAGGFDFQDMPSPETMGQRAGDPDEEFGDLAGEAFDPEPFGAADGFDAGDPFASEAVDDEGFTDDDFGTDASSDPFADAVGAHEAAQDDPFESDGDDPFADSEAAPVLPAAKSGRGAKRGLPLKPLLLTAAAGAFAWIGWGVVQPVLFPAQAPVLPQQQVEEPLDIPFPTALPPRQAQVDEPLLPSLPAAQPESVTGVPSIPLPPAETVLLPVPQAEDDPLIGLSDGPDMGGIDAIRAARDASTAEKVPDEEFVRFKEEVEAKLASIDGRLASVESAIRELGSRPASVQAPAGLPSDAAPRPVQAADLRSSVPPLKPEIVEGVTLKGVSRGLAWISTPSGVVEVKEGDPVPGAGTVVSIREYRGSWIVATTTGLVVQ